MPCRGRVWALRLRATVGQDLDAGQRQRVLRWIQVLSARWIQVQSAPLKARRAGPWPSASGDAASCNWYSPFGIFLRLEGGCRIESTSPYDPGPVSPRNERTTRAPNQFNHTASHTNSSWPDPISRADWNHLSSRPGNQRPFRFGCETVSRPILTTSSPMRPASMSEQFKRRLPSFASDARICECRRSPIRRAPTSTPPLKR